MGLFSAIKEAAITANEEAHGERLLLEFKDSIGKMREMPCKNSDEIIRRYVFNRAKILPEMDNWTSDGILMIAKTLKIEGRRVIDYNLVEGYSLWMTSVWLESAVRNSEKAKRIFNTLNDIASDYELNGNE